MSRDPEEIRSEIEETRDELADTAAALAYKTDVKARAKDRVTGAKAALGDKTPDSASGAASSVGSGVRSNPVPVAAVVALVAGVALGYWIAGRR